MPETPDEPLRQGISGEDFWGAITTSSRTPEQEIVQNNVSESLLSPEFNDFGEIDSDATAILSPATVRAYAADWRDFRAWCDRTANKSLPAKPGIIRGYLTDAAKRIRSATLTRRIAAISHYHRAAGFESPTAAPAIRRALKVIRLQIGTRKRKKSALLTEELKEALDLRTEGQGPAGALLLKRDRALLLLGFAGAFRRSEVIALDVEHLRFVHQGVVVTLIRSKTDQEGEGRTVAIPFGRDEHLCPVKALEAWLAAASIASGPIFRYVDRHGNVTQKRSHPKLVATVTKRAVELLGYDPDRYGGHSLRSGLATSAHIGGASDRSIMRTTGHKSREMLDEYIRDAELFRDNAARSAGL